MGTCVDPVVIDAFRAFIRTEPLNVRSFETELIRQARAVGPSMALQGIGAPPACEARFESFLKGWDARGAFDNRVGD